MEPKEALRLLFQVRDRYADMIPAVRRKKWSESEKAMTLMDVDRKIDAINYAIALVQHQAEIKAIKHFEASLKKDAV